MAKTPRFVTYNTAEYNLAAGDYVIHCYTPRFVAKMVKDNNGIIKAYLHDNWDNASDETIAPLLLKAKEWFYFKHR